MSSKKNFLVVLESQIDKIVLVVIILISLALMWFYVISNPYAQKVGAKKLSPGEIDKKIKQNADRLLEELDTLSTVSVEDHEVHLSDFEKLIACPISNIASDLIVQFPGIGDTIIEEDRLYDVPYVPALSEVQMASLRGAARVPVDEVGPANPYKNAETKLADMDLVTISGRLDVQSLYNNFRLSFDGPGLKSTWKDPKLATPVFAKMELERRMKTEDGSGGIGRKFRTKIDMYQTLLGQLPLSPEDMQFGINVYMSQFQDSDVQMDILQPDSYLFEISKTEWKPPQFLNETLDIIAKEKDEAKRELREERQKAAETAARGGTERRTAGGRAGGGTRERRSTRDRQPQQNRRGETMGMDEGRGRPVANRATRAKERTVTDIDRDVKTETLTATTVSRISSRRDPLMVWAHDDTAEPGRTYQYRIRVGVFNPIMGKEWFKQSQAEFKDQTVLWSRYSEPTEDIQVPKMLHVFPMETIAGASDAVEGAKIEVAKYHMGQWQSHAFDVFPGQVIGSSVTREELAKQQDVDTQEREIMNMRTMTGMNQMAEGDEVDFTTSMVMVDMLKDFNWGSRVKRSSFYQMLYHDIAGIVQMPVGKSYWPKDVKTAYSAVQAAMEEDVDSRGEVYGRPGMPGGGEVMF